MSAARMESAKVLVWCFIASESVFFVLLVLAFLALPPGASGGPTAAGALDPLRTGLYSVALFASSFTLVWGERGRGGRRLAAGLAVTAALGIVFLAFQGREWANLLAHGVTVRANTFGTTFYTLTGFHGLHVALGIVILAVVWRGARPGGVETAAVFWHMVDLVWVVMFPIIYLVR